MEVTMSFEEASNARGVRHARRIAVCGAGVAGLTLAVRLARLGFEVTVFEARDETAIETDGVFLTLAPNGMNGLRSIDLYQEVAASGIATTAIEILDERGRRLALVDQTDHETAFGAHSITIRRGQLAKLLLMRACAEGVTVRLGQRVVAVSESPSGLAIETGDGSGLRFDLLAACDGLRSRVRELVFPEFPKPRFTGLVGTGGFVDAPQVPATGGTMRMTFGRGAFFGYIKADAQPVFWFNSYPANNAVCASTPQAYASHLRHLHRDDPQVNRDVLAGVSEIERDYPIYDMPELPVWHRGNVVLLGDAAHAVGPHAGQGASMAIEDAVVLAACLDATDDRAAALTRYERLRRDRIRDVVRLTARNASQKRSSGWLSLMIRNLILPVVIPLGIKRARRSYAFRVDRNPLSAPAT
jgi:2-polyprenyl-6-methoxyphenol hydroxylase-like FAD-dependent oxidoreductase